MKFSRPSNEMIEKCRNDCVSYDGAEEVMSYLNRIDELIDKEKEKFDLSFSAYSNKSDHFSFYITELFKIVNKIRSIIYQIADITGTSDKETLHQIETVKAEFIEEEDYIKIIFPGLLPRRINYRNKSNVLTYTDMRRMYEPAFTEFLRKRKKTVWNKRVIIRYIHFFEQESQIRDYDNFETKIITDLITPLVNFDDSPKECIIMSDYRMGEKCHTEVDIIPYDKAAEKLFNNRFNII